MAKKVIFFLQWVVLWLVAYVEYHAKLYNADIDGRSRGKILELF